MADASSPATRTIKVTVPVELGDLKADELPGLAAEVEAVWSETGALRERLLTLIDAAAKAEETARRYLLARDGAQPVPTGEVKREDYPKWKQPLAAFDAYPRGYVVSFGQKLYQSTIPDNVHKPTDLNGGWAELELTDAPPPPQPVEVPDEQWTVGTTYTMPKPGSGDPVPRVAYAGVAYELVQTHTAGPGWEPPNVPALWREARPLM